MLIFYIYQVKSNTIKDSIPDPGFDPDTPFTMNLIEKSKTGRLIPPKTGERIASMPLEEFLDGQGYVEEDAVWWSFEIKDLVGEVSKGSYIWTKDEYAEFTGRLSKPEVKKKVFLRLTNAKEDKEEDSWAKKLSFIFGFFYKAMWFYIKYLGERNDWIGYDNDGMIKWDMIMMALIRRDGSIGANKLINRVYQ